MKKLLLLSLAVCLFSSLPLGEVKKANAEVILCQPPGLVPVPCTTASDGTLQVGGASGGGPATIADGADVTLGAKADAKNTATDTTPITVMSVLKQISASIQTVATWTGSAISVATHAVTQSGTWLFTQTPGTSGGVSTSSAIVPNNTTSVALKASAGQLYDLDGFGISATVPIFIKFYDAAQGSTTCGAGTPKLRYMIPTGTTGSGFIKSWPNGVPFSTAITYCITAAMADADTTSPAASSYVVNFGYK